MEKIVLGDKMKNIKGLFISGAIIIIITVVTILSIKQGKAQATSTENLQEKVNSEIKYLDSKLLSMLNGLNNIMLRNYVVTSKEVGQSSSDIDDESSGASKNNDETESEADSSSTDNEERASLHELQSAGVLTTSKDANWDTLKTEIEILYSSWSTIILDLYKLNINSEDILEFSTLLDSATIFIKNEDKTQSLATLANLYACLPKYVEGYSNDNKQINIQKTKSSIVNAYSVVENENWSEITSQVNNAELSFLNVLNSVSTEEDYEINKTYILLKELQNSITERDKDIFYIKYKNVIEKLNNMI